MTATTAAEQFVPLAELMRVVLEGRDMDVQAFVDAYGLREALVRDWNSVPCVAASVAKATRENHEQGKRRDEFLRAAHLAWVHKRGQRREAAMRAKFEEVFASELKARRKVDPRPFGVPIGPPEGEWLFGGEVMPRNQVEEGLRKRWATEEASEAARVAGAEFDSHVPDRPDLLDWLEHTREGQQAAADARKVFP